MNETELIMLARTVEYQYSLEKYTTKQTLALQKTIERTQKSVLRRFEAMTEHQRGRAVTLLAEMDELMLGVKASIHGVMASSAAEVSVKSAAEHSRILGWNGEAAAVSTVKLAPDVMTAFWTETPVGGVLLKDWVKRAIDSELQDKIKNEIARGLINGESYPAMIKRVKKGFTGTKHQLETLVKTYVHSAHSDAAERVYKRNKHIVERVRWVASFEGGAGKGRGTCIRCAVLDGQIFELGKGPSPPIHPRCRCIKNPVVDDEALGLPSKGKEKVMRPYRVMKDGKVTKGKLKVLDSGRFQGTYEDWLKKAPEHVALNMMGPTRYKMWKSGEMAFGDLITQRTYRIRRIDELKKLVTKRKNTSAAAPLQKPKKKPARKPKAAATFTSTMQGVEDAFGLIEKDVSAAWVQLVETRKGHVQAILKVRGEMLDKAKAMRKAGKPDQAVFFEDKATFLHKAYEKALALTEGLEAEIASKTVPKTSQAVRAMVGEQKTLQSTIKTNKDKLARLKEKSHTDDIAEQIKALSAETEAMLRRKMSLDDDISIILHAVDKEMARALTKNTGRKAKLKHRAYEGKTRVDSDFISHTVRAQQDGNFLARDLAKYVNDDLIDQMEEITIGLTSSNRAYHLANFKGRNWLAMPAKKQSRPLPHYKRTLFHEYGHHIEGQLNSTEIAQAFLDRRCKGEDFVELFQKGSGEWTRPDDFLNSYVGKHYKGATEVISMGMEWLYQKPGAFYIEDREHFELIVAIIRGDMKKAWKIAKEGIND